MLKLRHGSAQVQLFVQDGPQEAGGRVDSFVCEIVIWHWKALCCSLLQHFSGKVASSAGHIPEPFTEATVTKLGGTSKELD